MTSTTSASSSSVRCRARTSASGARYASPSHPYVRTMRAYTRSHFHASPSAASASATARVPNSARKKRCAPTNSAASSTTSSGDASTACITVRGRSPRCTAASNAAAALPSSSYSTCGAMAAAAAVRPACRWYSARCSTEAMSSELYFRLLFCRSIRRNPRGMPPPPRPTPPLRVDTSSSAASDGVAFTMELPAWWWACPGPGAGPSTAAPASTDDKCGRTPPCTAWSSSVAITAAACGGGVGGPPAGGAPPPLPSKCVSYRCGLKARRSW